MAATGVAGGGSSRAALARGLYEQDAWRNARGQVCAASARKALPRLAQQLGLELPLWWSGMFRQLIDEFTVDSATTLNHRSQ